MQTPFRQVCSEVHASWRRAGSESLRANGGNAIARVGCDPGTPLVIAVRRGAWRWAWLESVQVVVEP
jgi:hypothetical protein